MGKKEIQTNIQTILNENDCNQLYKTVQSNDKYKVSNKNKEQHRYYNKEYINNSYINYNYQMIYNHNFNPNIVRNDELFYYEQQQILYAQQLLQQQQQIQMQSHFILDVPPYAAFDYSYSAPSALPIHRTSQHT